MWGAEQHLTNEQMLEVLKRLPTGSVTLLDGPSGCGKTQLLRQLAESGVREIEIYSVGELEEYFRERQARASHLLWELPGNDIIAIEDIDFLESIKSMQVEVLVLIKRTLKEHAIVLTGIKLRERVNTIVDGLSASTDDFTIWEYTDEQPALNDTTNEL